VQAYDRYGYGLNNPSTYTDPTGHAQASDDDECYGCTPPPSPIPTSNSSSSSNTGENKDKPDIFVAVTNTSGPNIYVPVNYGGGPYIFVPVSGSGIPLGFTPVSGGNGPLIFVPVGPEDISWVYTSTEPDFPNALEGGESNNFVYLGYDENGNSVYAGITNDIDRRQTEHGDRFRIEALNENPLTRGQARAIEQALIANNGSFENERNSISPRHPYYQPAVNWGNWWLEQNGPAAAGT